MGCMFVIDGDERGYLDVAELYETEIEPDLPEHPGPNLGPVRIEQWATNTGRALLPSADMVVEHLAEIVWEEAGEIADDFVQDIVADEEVLKLSEALCAAMGERATFFTAHHKLSDHLLSWDDGEPLLDGERMYGRRA